MRVIPNYMRITTFSLMVYGLSMINLINVKSTSKIMNGIIKSKSLKAPARIVAISILFTI